MFDHTRFGRALTVAALALALSACATTTTPDLPDCDGDDRARHETPDCGFTHRGSFYEWSWVKAGRTTAPAGWKKQPEIDAVTRPATSTPTVKATKGKR